ncbi:hypothetical protein QAD02_006357 [Eretmocerus hayati]|uniref:Uncharacterized protein n=1 Tax=Eretmocerus hayati TaxID=131215 RepID=A0ACC2N4U6_9HYME|nr:hypothetical protein QAD02_006357 [Eretmocerus hayati]
MPASERDEPHSNGNVTRERGLIYINNLDETLLFPLGVEDGKVSLQNLKRYVTQNAEGLLRWTSHTWVAMSMDDKGCFMIHDENCEYKVHCPGPSRDQNTNMVEREREKNVMNVLERMQVNRDSKNGAKGAKNAKKKKERALQIYWKYRPHGGTDYESKIKNPIELIIDDQTDWTIERLINDAIATLRTDNNQHLFHNALNELATKKSNSVIRGFLTKDADSCGLFNWMRDYEPSSKQKTALVLLTTGHSDHPAFRAGPASVVLQPRQPRAQVSRDSNESPSFGVIPKVQRLPSQPSPRDVANQVRREASQPFDWPTSESSATARQHYQPCPQPLPISPGRNQFGCQTNRHSSRHSLFPVPFEQVPPPPQQLPNPIFKKPTATGRRSSATSVYSASGSESTPAKRARETIPSASSAAPSLPSRKKLLPPSAFTFPNSGSQPEQATLRPATAAVKIANVQSATQNKGHTTPRHRIVEFLERVPTPMTSLIGLELISFGEVIGAGQFGKVKKANVKGMSRGVAVKIMPSRNTKQIAKEVLALSKFTHDNLTKIHGVACDSHHVYIVMEFIDGLNLKEALFDGSIESKIQFTEFDRHDICLGIAQGIEYLHAPYIKTIHRDLKPENVMIDRISKIPKICDFGYAKDLLKAAVLETTDDSLRFTGTPLYQAPEVFLHEQGCSFASDVWSLACTITELYRTEHIWPAKHKEELKNIFVSKQTPEMLGIPHHLKNCIAGCFSYDPRSRPKADVIANCCLQMEDIQNTSAVANSNMS